MDFHFIHRRKLALSMRTQLSIVGLFIALAGACLDTVWSVFLYGFLQNASYVGFFSSFITLLTVISMIVLTSFLEKHSERKFWTIGAIGFTFAYIGYFFSSNLYLVTFFSVIYAVSRAIFYQSYGILVCNSCKKDDLCKTEGLVWAIRNLGFVIGPLMAAFIAAELGLRSVFFFSATFVIFALIVFRDIKLQEFIHKHDTIPGVRTSFKNFLRFFRRKDLVKHYIISGGMQFFQRV